MTTEAAPGSNAPPPEPVGFRLPTRIVLIQLGCIVLGYLCGITLLWLPLRNAGPWSTVVRAGLLVVFAYWALAAGRTAIQALRRRPAVVLSTDGIRLTRRLRVAWTDIAAVHYHPDPQPQSLRGTIGIELRDPAAHLSRLSLGLRRAARRELAAGRPPILLPGQRFRVSLFEVVTEMRRFHPGLLVES